MITIRPKKDVQFTFRLPQAVLDALEVKASQLQEKVSTTIRAILVEKLRADKLLK